jgi:methylated-DNA-[protein]-cysteine S-methyltransferase
MMTQPHDLTAGKLLAGLPEAGEQAQRRLRDRLAAAADAAGILDVAYRTIDTPVGSLLLAATGQGLVRVAYPTQNHDAVLDQLAAKVSPRVLRAPARLDAAAREIDEYFAGRRTRFDLPLDLRLCTGFRRQVISRLPGISYGTTASYAAMAAAAGSPRAVRAVGTACAANPLPVVMPCHRVVRSDGSLGGYAGGTEAKQTLLTLEGASAAAAVRHSPGQDSSDITSTGLRL